MDANRSAGAMQAMARSLAEHAERLCGRVDSFVAEMRAA
jgi:hypothetical protein